MKSKLRSTKHYLERLRLERHRTNGHDMEGCLSQGIGQRRIEEMDCLSHRKD